MPEEAPANLSELIDTLVDETEGDQVSLREIMSTISTRSYGPILLVTGLVAASPMGAIPGMSVVTGSIILLTAAQLLVGRSHPWLPKLLLGLSFNRSKLTQTRKKLRPWFVWAEGALQTRLTALVEPPFKQLIALGCIGLAILFYPLALVPFGVILPALAICFFALALSARDGLLAIFAFTVTAAAFAATIVFWPL